MSHKKATINNYRLKTVKYVDPLKVENHKKCFNAAIHYCNQDLLFHCSNLIINGEQKADKWIATGKTNSAIIVLYGMINIHSRHCLVTICFKR